MDFEAELRRLEQEARFFPERVVRLLYAGNSGETASYRVLPVRLGYGGHPRHRGPQWLLTAYDVEARRLRTFGMHGIRDWQPEHPEEREP